MTRANLARQRDLFELSKAIKAVSFWKLFWGNSVYNILEILCVFFGGLLYHAVNLRMPVNMWFAEFEEVSALSLNIAKAVFIPLWDARDLTNVRRLVQEHCPAWKLVSIVHFARYLRFLVDPAADSHQWDAPSQKFLGRLYKWSALPVGSFLRLKMFKTFSLPTLSFVMRLVDLPSNINEIQSLCVRKLSPGPGNWISMRDAQHLQRKWHFPIELDDFHILSLAIRVWTWRQVGARCEEAVRELDGAFANCHCPFPTWFSLSFYRVLWNTVLEVRSRGIDLEGFLLQACNQCSLQQTLVKTLKLKNVTPYCPILRLEDKFDRWRLSERGNIACCRALRCLQHISKHSRPAVVITVLFCAFGSMAGQPPVECETCLPIKQLRDATLVANFVKILLNIIRAAVLPYFFEILLLPPSPWFGNCFQAQVKGFFFMVKYDLCENDVLKLARVIHALQFFSLGASPVEPSSNLNIDKVLMLLVKQAAAGFNASMEIFQPSRNATLYDIDTPILSQLEDLILQHLQRLRGKLLFME